uniref:Uncharacterized protein n=1 Tax=Candidozyma auris TaxID=498019 RepID=A0A0L0NXF1_CANAR
MEAYLKYISENDMYDLFNCCLKRSKKKKNKRKKKKKKQPCIGILLV